MKECSKGHAQRGRECDAAKNGLPAPHHEEEIQTVPIAWHVHHWLHLDLYLSCIALAGFRQLEFGQCLHFGLAGKLAIIHACKQRKNLNTNII